MTDAAAIESYLANCFRDLLRERRRRRLRLAGIVAIVIIAAVLDLIWTI